MDLWFDAKDIDLCKHCSEKASTNLFGRLLFIMVRTSPQQACSNYKDSTGNRNGKCEWVR